MDKTTKDDVMADFARLRDAVDAWISIGAVSFTERAGNWVLVRDRAPLTADLVRESLKEVYREAGHYLAEGSREFTVVYGPWTLKLQEE